MNLKLRICIAIILVMMLSTTAGGWERYTTPQCECSCGGLATWYEVVDRWVEYTGNHQAKAAQSFFQANRPTFAETAGVRSVEVRRYPVEWKTVRQDYTHIHYEGPPGKPTLLRVG